MGSKISAAINAARMIILVMLGLLSGLVRPLTSAACSAARMIEGGGPFLERARENAANLETAFCGGNDQHG
jgi:hypothetical protein